VARGNLFVVIPTFFSVTSQPFHCFSKREEGSVASLDFISSTIPSIQFSQHSTVEALEVHRQ
jgi:hypothetical protein